MTLQPFLSASPIIQIHAAAALAALAVGTLQLARPKGGAGHRAIGWVWVALMVTVAVSSFWISGERFRFGPFSWIHGLSAFTLVMLPVAILHARRHRVASHRSTMISLFVGALVIAGLFTLTPGRIMGRVVFGG